MPRNCSIPGCTSRRKRVWTPIIFHELPTDSERRHQWLVSIKRSIRVSPFTYICSLHCKDNKKESSNDIPTTGFPWSTTTTRKSPVLHPFTPPEPKKRKQEVDTSKQLQEYAYSLTELRLECSKLEKELRVTQELESIKLSRVERFGISRFQGSDDDIRFYTGLPSYDILLCLYRYLEPFLIYLCYCPSKHEQPTRQLLNHQRLL
jgi:hypothetical protein